MTARAHSREVNKIAYRVAEECLDSWWNEKAQQYRLRGVSPESAKRLYLKAVVDGEDPHGVPVGGAAALPPLHISRRVKSLIAPKVLKPQTKFGLWKWDSGE